MKIALFQTNPVIGDFDGNCLKILEAVATAREQQCDLAVFPELSLCGYPPRDLLERPSFLKSHDKTLAELVDKVHGIGVIIGALERRSGPGKPLYNSAFLLDEGQIIFRVRKQLLPTYDIFDETRYFEPGDPAPVIPFKGKNIGLSVCEDIWFDPEQHPLDPFVQLADLSEERPLDFLINISASPYSYGKLLERQQLFGDLCRRLQAPLLYVNQVGGQDSLLFDGHSMVMTAAGEIIASGEGFSEDMLLLDSDTWETAKVASAPSKVDTSSHVLAALTMGVRDYLGKTGFSKAILGLSGGIDSALTAVIASRALGAENVLCVALPSPYTSQASIDDARQLAVNLGCSFKIVPIENIMGAYQQLLEPIFEGYQEDVTEQNIQARIRGNILMAMSNKFGHILLSTGNKSELAVGYCTLYGDMSGGLSVLADVPKELVYSLSREINSEAEIIPHRIITRPPTAELKPDQCDQDDLPPYEVLDPILTAYLEEHASVADIVSQGYERQLVEDVVRRITVNEYKRKQAPLGLKVTTKAFGYGRRYPIVQKFRE